MDDSTTAPRDPPTLPASKRHRPVQRTGWPGLPGFRPVSLADVRAGEVVEIVDILFDIVRNHCWALGLVVGDVYECVAAGEDEIALAHAVAGRVKVGRDCAQFVLTLPPALAMEIARDPAANGGDTRSDRP